MPRVKRHPPLKGKGPPSPHPPWLRRKVSCFPGHLHTHDARRFLLRGRPCPDIDRGVKRPEQPVRYLYGKQARSTAFSPQLTSAYARTHARHAHTHTRTHPASRTHAQRVQALTERGGWFHLKTVTKSKNDRHRRYCKDLTFP